MIEVAREKGSKELLPYITRIGVQAELSGLQFGDFAFEGKGPKGSILIGVERKTLHDMLHCIDDSRYSAHQRPGMLAMYQKSYLILEGYWKPHENGTLMEGFEGGTKWGACKYRSSHVLYSKLYRYLLSVSLSGVIVIYSRDIYHTAYNICECFHYFQKPWDKHTSLIEVQKLAIPDLRKKPSLVRRWASDLEGVGVIHSLAAERLFRTPLQLAQSDEMDWLRIPGIGVPTAQKIIKEIHGTSSRR